MPYRFRNITGAAIRELREKRNMTQLELAARLQVMGLANIDRGNLSKIEAGTRSIYDYELAIIAETLGVTIGALIPSTKEIRKNLPRLIGEKYAKGE